MEYGAENTRMYHGENFEIKNIKQSLRIGEDRETDLKYFTF